MRTSLTQIPGLDAKDQTEWKVRALELDGNSDVRRTLLEWKRSHPAEYRKIMKAIRMAARQHRVKNPKLVKPCADKTYAGTYEFRADKGHARLMFFYDEGTEMMIVCTNCFFGKGGAIQKQKKAFKHCHQLMELYYDERGRK